MELVTVGISVGMLVGLLVYSEVSYKMEAVN